MYPSQRTEHFAHSKLMYNQKIDTVRYSEDYLPKITSSTYLHSNNYWSHLHRAYYLKVSLEKIWVAKNQWILHLEVKTLESHHISGTRKWLKLLFDNAKISSSQAQVNWRNVQLMDDFFHTLNASDVPITKDRTFCTLKINV